MRKPKPMSPQSCRAVVLRVPLAQFVGPQPRPKGGRDGIEKEITAKSYAREAVAESEEEYLTQEFVNELEDEMRKAAEDLEFERAAELRDKIMEIREEMGLETSDGLATMTKTKPESNRKKGRQP